MILSPLLTLPVSWGVLFLLPNYREDEPRWELAHMRLALLSGFVDLVVFAWLVSSNSQVKKAAAAAGVIGVVKVALPQLAVGFYAARFGGQAGSHACAVSVFLLIPLVLLILAVWIVSAIVATVMFLRVTRATPGQSV